MTEAGRPTFSVIVVSRQRPVWLTRCVMALKQLDYPAFEIIVVADSESLFGFDDATVKTVSFDAANISAARNLGVVQAAGEVCAFIDDDAVPEPRWLRHLADAFETTSADAVVGYVRGRNGISFQSRASSVDAEAETHSEPTQEDAAFVPELRQGRAVKLVGTNMAIRREALTDIGGFDEAFRFFLEDADLSLRLHQAGKRIAVVPLAQVHHGFAPSVRRSGRRAPLDLFDIGRSTRHFIGKHGAVPEDEIWERTQKRERARLVKHMVAGTCEPKGVVQRMSSLRKGWLDGENAQTKEIEPLRSADIPFRQIEPGPPGHEVLAAPFLWNRRRLLHTASELARNGQRVSVFSFSLTPARHHVRYIDPGIWTQTGGLFGKSDREDRLFKWCRFADRLQREIRRVANQRGIGDIVER